MKDISVQELCQIGIAKVSHVLILYFKPYKGKHKNREIKEQPAKRDKTGKTEEGGGHVADEEKKEYLCNLLNHHMTISRMRKMFFAACLVLTLGACGESDEKKAASLFVRIGQLYETGRYGEALDSIRSLRKKYPQAMEARKKALTIWQDASLKMIQADIAATDSALQSVLGDIGKTGLSVIPARLRIRRDSLQIRYDVLCATVRAIHRKQKE